MQIEEVGKSSATDRPPIKPELHSQLRLHRVDIEDDCLPLGPKPSTPRDKMMMRLDHIRSASASGDTSHGRIFRLRAVGRFAEVECRMSNVELLMLSLVLDLMLIVERVGRLFGLLS
jgi:hypothetical protein